MATPEDLLILAADCPLEIDSPRIRLWIKVQRSEGNPDLDGPTVRANVRFNFPDAVPSAAATGTATSASAAVAASTTTVATASGLG